MEHMDILQVEGTTEPSRYVYTRRADLNEAFGAAGIETRRFGGYATDGFTVNYVHLMHKADVDHAARVVAALGWRDTEIVNIDGMLAVTTTF